MKYSIAVKAARKKKLAFTNFIMGNGPLSGAFKPTNSRTPFYEVLLTHPTINALSHKLKLLRLRFRRMSSITCASDTPN
jgi:hypothetical protein